MFWKPNPFARDWRRGIDFVAPWAAWDDYDPEKRHDRYIRQRTKWRKGRAPRDLLDDVLRLKL